MTEQELKEWLRKNLLVEVTLRHGDEVHVGLRFLYEAKPFVEEYTTPITRRGLNEF